MQIAVQDVTAGRRRAELEQGGLTGDADCCAGCNSGSSDPVDLPSTLCGGRHGGRLEAGAAVLAPQPG
jgi:hypothetical protein